MAAQSWLGRRGRLASLLGASPAAPALLAAAAPPPAPVAAEQKPILPDAVADWLAQLTLLYGVPFEYLVADARLLPSESLRFFYLDRNWLDRLVDGALSVATLSTAEAIFYEAVFEQIYAQIDQHQQNLRTILRGGVAGDAYSPGATYSGMLMRSAVVSGWPGLEVAATASGAAVPLLRMDRLSTDVLLVLFMGVPDTVNLIEPGEGLHFGVRDDPQTAGRVIVDLRGLGFAQLPAGDQLIGKTAGTTMRSGQDQPPGVLDMASLARDIATNLPQGALGPGGALTSGGFALELVRAAGLQEFNTKAPPPSPRAAAPAVRAAAPRRLRAT